MHRSFLARQNRTRHTEDSGNPASFETLVQYLASPESWENSSYNSLTQHQKTLPRDLHAITFKSLLKQLKQECLRHFYNIIPSELVGRSYFSDRSHTLPSRIPTLRECTHTIMKEVWGPFIGCSIGLISFSVWAAVPAMVSLPQWGLITNSVFSSLFMLAAVLAVIFYLVNAPYYERPKNRYKRFLSNHHNRQALESCVNLNAFFQSYPQYKPLLSGDAPKENAKVMLAIRDPEAPLRLLT